MLRCMTRFHHANLGVPTGGIETEATFLVDVLGFERVTGDGIGPVGAHWFQVDEEVQIHLSEDSDHRPATRAHVAVTFSDERLAAIEDHFAKSAWEHSATNGETRRTVNCRDPAGNRWELRGTSVPPKAASD